ncbi:MAG TPA: Na+/H+ antiporter subunit E [Ilumatobacter sp.]|nr:Na+/H+ antiporter subunit E [Ilumatobacter sp.]
MNRIALALWLVVVWVALWGDLSIANVASGTALAVLLLGVFPTHGERRRGLFIRPVATLRLVWYFARQMVGSNLALTRSVVSRSDRLRTGVIAVPLVCDSDGLVTVLHHLIALTPGTTVIEVERNPARIFVHILQLDDIDAARAEIALLERRVIEAFGPVDAVARVRAATAETGG